MPKNALPQTCCVCLNKALYLTKISYRKESKVSSLSKLRSCVPEVEWLASYFICTECLKLLELVYSFRETCIKSDQLRKQEEHKDVKTEDDPSKPDDVKTETDADGDEDNQDTADYLNDSSDEESKKETKEEGQKSNGKRKRSLEFRCEKCSYVFNSSLKLVDHCVEEHQMSAKDVRPFACDRCPSRFGNSSNLLQHIKYHEAIRSNICPYCGKGFITKSDLSIHEKQHLNKREYKCDTCGKCFNTHKDIRSHKLVVHSDSNTWKYMCTICSKPFPIKSNYDSHMRRHTGDKKFECHLCNKKFTDKCVLQRHMRTHSNVREHKCAHCDKEYKDQRVMKVHMAKVHGIGLGFIKLPSKDRKYICHICPRAYYARNKLTRHLYTHSGEKPFQCTICDKKFNDKSYLKQHMKKTHNSEIESKWLSLEEEICFETSAN
ncbi:gastrula zinc finger protein XlCGF52.1-like isoform X1 [Cylas formicarius]|uniref:gastrula zinc finger protein XlCGF52.1-like isoform X1 n=1 Tax=Cylas formicarius TaxID=197179 RepID=UPI0029583887|nr:gastrula zinc finger protein XlCGF52.1-like isoform X1 [Cylas formicarius]